MGTNTTLAMKPAVDEITMALHKLQAAVANETSAWYCLRLWSRFIRLRDGNRCVVCHTKSDLCAHHIVRKSFLPQARFQTGNGITLCGSCHAEPHEAFNQHPNLDLPMDAQGGENIDILTALFSTLVADAKKRKMLNDEYYYLSDEVLRIFKAFQGLSPDLPFPGSRLEQSFLIWQQTPREMLNAILRANGIFFPKDFLQMGSFILVTGK